ncbi:hypothetical protein [Modestobacter roseus]|uniref:Uncharacterized protein n=1 Tax=Modestobacter roseus TaxID=1181884 RepID=A0A562IVC7_9ACTN|nr:hypothetical protein [Modestobacter roseus]MQA33566.1 hypothetical protein [Modestobacter roseus]TWH74800.1 hypothetical protein JD78_03345 [Modestobacter roseus]
MVDLSDATQLLVFGSTRVPKPESRHLLLLAEGVVHVDFDDPDHVFLATVTRVARVHLPTGDPVVAVLDGVGVRLTDVELANHVTVVLAGSGPDAEEQARAYTEAFSAWGAVARHEAPPSAPGERLSALHCGVTDDVGTVYALSSGAFGGSEDPWQGRWQFLPLPPPDARRLRVTVGDGPAVDVPLPDRS